MEGSKGSFIWHNAGNNNLRHNNDAEVQPVPRVPQEGEGPDAETPRQDFYQRLERVNASERVPGRKRERRDGQEVRLGRIEKKKTPEKTHTEIMSGAETDTGHTWCSGEMWSTFTVQQPLHETWMTVAAWWAGGHQDKNGH